MHWLRNFTVAGPLVAAMAACLAMMVLITTPVSAAEEKPKPQTLFINVNVFDGKADKLASGMSVLIEGNLIKQVAKGKIKATGATVIDGGGRTLMPGLGRALERADDQGGASRTDRAARRCR